MTPCRRVFLSAVLFAACLIAWPGVAQNDRLDPGLIGKNGLWNAQERLDVETFVIQHVTSLMSGDEDRMTVARDALIRPFETAGATDLFKRQLTTEIAKQLTPAAEAELVKVRVNAAVVAERFTHTDGLPLIVTALEDPNAGVRYPAAKAIGNLLRNAEINPVQSQQILDLLEERIDVEDDPFIVEPLLEAVLSAGGAGRVLAALNRRLDWHIARPEAGFDPERKSMFAVYERLAIDPNPLPENVRQLARAGARYMLLASQQLNQGAVPQPIERSHTEMIKLAQVALRFAQQNLGAQHRLPQDVEQVITFRNWGEMLRIAGDWIDHLANPRYNFTPEQLTIDEQQPAQ